MVPTESKERSDEPGDESGTGSDEDRFGEASTMSDCERPAVTSASAGARPIPDDRRRTIGTGGARLLLDRLKLGRGLGIGIDSLSLSSLPDQPSSYANGSDRTLLNDM